MPANRFLLASLCSLALALSPIFGMANESLEKDATQEASATQPAPTPEESKLLERGHYTNKEGKTVHSPAHSTSGDIPKGASAQCRDGTYSFSQHRSGTCSHHGGVAKWVNP